MQSDEEQPSLLIVGVGNGLPGLYIWFCDKGVYSRKLCWLLLLLITQSLGFLDVHLSW